MKGKEYDVQVRWAMLFIKTNVLFVTFNLARNS